MAQTNQDLNGRLRVQEITFRNSAKLPTLNYRVLQVKYLSTRPTILEVAPTRSPVPQRPRVRPPRLPQLPQRTDHNLRVSRGVSRKTPRLRRRRRRPRLPLARPRPVLRQEPVPRLGEIARERTSGADQRVGSVAEIPLRLGPGVGPFFWTKSFLFALGLFFSTRFTKKPWARVDEGHTGVACVHGAAPSSRARTADAYPCLMRREVTRRHPRPIRRRAFPAAPFLLLLRFVMTSQTRNNPRSSRRAPYPERGSELHRAIRIRRGDRVPPGRRSYGQLDWRRRRSRRPIAAKVVGVLLDV